MKKLLWLLFLLLLFILSYFREITFIGINSIIDGQAHNYANTQLPDFFQTLSIPQLSQLKWALTVGFSLLFILLTYSGIRFSIAKTAGWWALIVYGVCTVLAIASIMIGLIFLDFADIYPFVRALVGLIHSPIVFLLISISHYSLKALNTNFLK